MALRVCLPNPSFALRSTSSPFQTDIQTVTFPLSATIFKSEEDRRFFVSATDGRTTRDTALAQIDGQSVRWNELLNELSVPFRFALSLSVITRLVFSTLGPTAQLILRIFENHRLRPNKCLAIFVLSYDSLRSSQNSSFQRVCRLFLID